ncbi:MAG: lysophospholipid acyltransferase family protein [Pseudomonadota bacterium]
MASEIAEQQGEPLVDDSGAMDFRPWRALAQTGLVALVLMPLQALLVRFAPQFSYSLPRMFHASFCKTTGVQVLTRGQAVRGRPVLYVANHLSWVDIPVVGSRIDTCFVAKSEVRGWGIFGLFSRLQRTIFVDRERRHKSATQRNLMVDRFREGRGIVLFAEGTSTDGNSVLPFKTALFSVAEAATSGEYGPPVDLLVQPVTVSYTRVNGIPIIRGNRHKVAWIGDAELMPHAWEFLKLGRVTALVQFHEPVRPEAFASRKELAQHCQAEVARGLALANGGRFEADP